MSSFVTSGSRRHSLLVRAMHGCFRAATSRRAWRSGEGGRKRGWSPFCKPSAKLVLSTWWVRRNRGRELCSGRGEVERVKRDIGLGARGGRYSRIGSEQRYGLAGSNRQRAPAAGRPPSNRHV